jgi:hypothetical protein
MRNVRGATRPDGPVRIRIAAATVGPSPDVSSCSRFLSVLSCALLFAVTLTAIAAPAGASPLPRKPAHKPAHKPDPVLTAITVALKRKAITPAKAALFRRTWASSARTSRTARTSVRRANIRAVRAYATTLARRRGLTPQRLDGVFLSIRATSTLLASRRPLPRHEQEVRLPGEPLVFTFYRGRGIQYQPFESFKLAVSYLDAKPARVGAARRVANRMLELGATRRGALAWEFYFPFGGPATPWHSAIAQALALRLYSRLVPLVPEADRAPYVAASDAIVQSFLRSPLAGGVSTPQGTGSFYVMYSFNPRQRILNGDLESLLSLYRYSVATGSPAAKRAYDRGYAALVPLMPHFDRGDWSNYQLGQEATRNYHEFMTTELAYLARETNDPFFIDYARRFRIYLEDPPKLGVRFVLLPSLVLPIDGYRDTIPVRYELNKSARVTLIITTPGGRELRRISDASHRGINTMFWDGRTASGAFAPDGPYVGRFATIDRFRRRSATPIAQSFVIEHDTDAPIPILATLVESADGTSTQVTINVEETASQFYDGQLFIAGAPITAVVRVKSGPITFNVPRPRAEVETASVHFVDSSGNESLTELSSVLNPSTTSG